MSKTFIDFKNGLETVIGFLDQESFCGNFKLKTPSGEYISKQGVFKRTQPFTKYGVTIDFTNYLNNTNYDEIR